MFIDDFTLATSFPRLRHSQHKGKKGKERTSGLMYLLAFDQLVHTRGGQTVLDFDPETEQGRFHRKMFAFNFSALVSINSHNALQIVALGTVTSGSIRADKRVSANFLTVPLTKAAQAQAPRDYPNRPVPLLALGRGKDGMKWGVGYHQKWLDNLGTFLMENGSKTPFTDLAILVLRDYDFSDTTGPITSVIRSALSSKFTSELTEHWLKIIEFEHIKPCFPTIQFQTAPSKVLENPALLDGHPEDSAVEAEQLKIRVTYLESLLVENGIEFDEEYQ